MRSTGRGVHAADDPASYVPVKRAAVVGDEPLVAAHVLELAAV